ncbi:MAG: filamentous hemagglutinin family protein [Methylobacter sp.]|nr:filamentous hemagglutinin family protein [Methylobacter sp.]
MPSKVKLNSVYPITVNQSRAFALSGGDIDAGRGAKSAIAAPPPEYSFDENGNLVVTFPPIVSGTAYRALRRSVW